MSAVIVFEWSFTPPDYFEVPIKIVRDDYALTISHGKVEARLDAALYEAKQSIRQTLHQGLDDRFLGVQLLTHRAYELSRSTMTRVHPDGRKDFFVEPESGRIAITGYAADIQVRDKEGNIIADSKRNRIEKKRSIADLVSTYRASDEVLTSLLRSDDAAVRDPNNELVHLYEIRDALSLRFGGDREARAALGVSSSDWARFGLLCNHEPLRQGRHRGKTGASLRDATEAELGEARRIARSMTENYLSYLDSRARGSG